MQGEAENHHRVTITGTLEVEIQPDGFTAKLLKKLRYDFGVFRVTVQAGWITDWASVPRFFWRIFPPMGRYTLAAILHDYLYEFHIGTRARADWLFLEVMRHLGVSWPRRWTMYLAVRAFGWYAWRT